ncbi:hypothetical protein AB0K15_17800 [Amycolatopsis sp. NPDC049253]|uniref:hypothetical protein n=1 Tax=Amycolatopsis sp. NPDC049253 TaxID=3155274 RepID=UPI00341BFB19
MITAIDNLPIAKHSALPPAARTAAAAVETIAEDAEITCVDQLAASAGLSARALQRLSKNTPAARPSGRSGYTA